MFKNLLRLTLVKMPSYRVPIEDEVFRSMKVDNFSKTPYSDATQVCDIIKIIIINHIRRESLSFLIAPDFIITRT